MDPRIYESGASESPPDAPANPSAGYPTDGNPATGTPATLPGAHWFYKIGESLRNVITAAGLTPSDSDLTLFQQAILKIVSATNHVVRLEDVTFGPSVADGDAVYWDNANSRYDRAIADGTDKQKMVGFADVTNGLVEAFGRSALFSGMTAGTKYYLSGSTAGAITATAPAEKVVVGLAKSATTLFVDIDPIDKELGQGQAWQNFTASRVAGVVYTNTTGRSIQLSIQQTGDISQLLIDGLQVVEFNGDASSRTNGFPIIPNGSTYEFLAGTGSIGSWWELR